MLSTSGFVNDGTGTGTENFRPDTQDFRDMRRSDASEVIWPERVQGFPKLFK